jgi:hypothetical protein
MLDDEVDRLRLDARLVETLALRELSDPSTLDEELDKLFELVLSAARVASMLDELFERLRLET